MKALRLLNVLMVILILIAVSEAYVFWRRKTSPSPSLVIPRSPLVIPSRGAWNFIVPDHYIGDLAIAFRCPGGHPLTLRHGVITTRFPVAGPACVSDVIDPDVDPSQIHAWWANGAPLATYRIGGPIVAGQTVFAPVTGEGQGSPTQSNWFFMVYYVGPSECAKDSQVFRFHDHLPARCHYEAPFAFTKQYAG